MLLFRQTSIRLAVLSGLLLAGCASPTVPHRVAYFPPPPSAARVVHLKSFNRLSDLVAQPASFIERVRGGAISPQVVTPAGIAYTDDHLYVCDTTLNVVHDWNLSTGDAKRIGESSERDVSLKKPVDVAVDEAGIVYVADTSRGAVYAYDASGNTVARFRHSQSGEYKPVAVAVRGSALYVADIASHRVDVFSTPDAKHIASIGQVGSEPGAFYYPMGVATTPDGGLAVSDMMNARVQVVDASNEAVATMGQPGDRYGDMGKPKHLAVGFDGVIFIADPEFARIHLFDSQGRLLMLLGSTTSTPMPIGVAVAATLPDALTSLVPADFDAQYYLFATDAAAPHRISLFAVGARR